MLTTPLLRVICLTAILILGSSGCSVLKDVAGQVRDISRMKFKLQNVSNVQVAGVSLQGKTSLSDFSLADGLRLTKAFAGGSLPVNLTLNIQARRPDGSSAVTASQPLTLKALDWELFIDQKKTVTGVLGAPVTLPQGTQETVLPLQIALDAKEFFGNKGYEDLITLLLAMGGAQGSANLMIKAVPEVQSALGTYRYPTPITIIDKTFTE